MSCYPHMYALTSNSNSYLNTIHVHIIPKSFLEKIIISHLDYVFKCIFPVSIFMYFTSENILLNITHVSASKKWKNNVHVHDIST